MLSDCVLLFTFKTCHLLVARVSLVELMCVSVSWSNQMSFSEVHCTCMVMSDTGVAQVAEIHLLLFLKLLTMHDFYALESEIIITR